MSEDAKDEGPTAEDEDPAVENEGLIAGVEGPDIDDEGYGVDDESHGRDDESRGIDDEGYSIESGGLRLGYGALRRRELALEEGDVYSTFEVGQGSGSAPESEKPERTPPLPEWTSGSLPISPSHSDVPSHVSSPIIPLTIPSPATTPTTVEAKGFLTELGAQVEMQGGLIRDHAVRLEELSPALFERYDRDIGELFTRSGAVMEEIFFKRYRFRSLEYEQERVALAEERRARLELAKDVDGMRRGQEPRGGA
ncbi:hypothetical protein Tco_1328912 [Tanacetum coccineum]